MLRMGFYIAICIMLASCCTLLNGKYQKVKIFTENGVQIREFENNDVIKKDSISYSIKRDNLPVVVKIQKDTLTDSVTLNWHVSSLAYLQLLAYPYGFVGLAIDMTNNRRYAYPNRNFIVWDSTGPPVLYKYNPTSNIGNRTWFIGIPFYNNITGKTKTGFVNTYGFYGLELRAGIYNKENRSYSANAGVSVGSPLPFPAFVDEAVHIDQSVNTFFNLEKGYHIANTELGMGLGFLYNQFVGNYKVDKYCSSSVGLSISSTSRIGERFCFRIHYQPSLITVSNRPVMEYQHLISVGFGWVVN